MPRPSVPSSVPSWTLRQVAGRSWEVRDAVGTPRARVDVPERDARAEEAAVPVPRSRARLPVTLPDGSTATLRNGVRRFGSRRRRTRGQLELAGRRYEFSHRTGRRARVLRDGVRLATATRSGEAADARQDLIVHEVLDPLDELAVVLFCRVLRPGRISVPGAVAELLDALPTFP